jgi:hypothetical protein
MVAAIAILVLTALVWKRHWRYVVFAVFTLWATASVLAASPLLAFLPWIMVVADEALKAFAIERGQVSTRKDFLRLGAVHGIAEAAARSLYFELQFQATETALAQSLLFGATAIAGHLAIAALYLSERFGKSKLLYAPPLVAHAAWTFVGSALWLSAGVPENHLVFGP